MAMSGFTTGSSAAVVDLGRSARAMQVMPVVSLAVDAIPHRNRAGTLAIRGWSLGAVSSADDLDLRV